ncbi:calmodulin-binding receptor-like cytoplasmic kinase 3 [Dendrobium catenatum]|uniref:non-specific serine/threonine protein kinase n=1 Tax=Dendrobium catenatum TaxID=906689 RepID=A0A2I0WRR9_9ASPA|nr:calmodulin-binding receptor-like cytoplasmic kinase 3 [Dendrobium catenatum]PKU78358.1 Calmodulin-binding receptor-like cytoplasmic kinase 3 [Dendrobium catenatum]
MASILAFLILVASPFAEAAVGESVRGVSRICSSDRVGYLRLQDGYRVFVNGQPIDDRVLMCEALAFFLASKCLEFDSRVEEWGEIARKYCARNFKYIAGLDHDAVSGEVFHTAGRKLLLQPQKDSSKLDRLSRKELSKYEVKDLRLKIPPKSKFLAFPGMFLLCCAVICPCFRARRKEPIEQKALANETNSSDSVTPLDVSASPDKNLTTPHKVPQSPSRFSLSPQQNRIGSLQLTVNQIIKATQNFSPSLKLGEGGFGTVYKGILGDGQIVAVKRAKKEHFGTLRDEFSSEVELLAKIEHRSLVRLLGYTEKGNERIIVTEYVPNGTLREHLDGLHGHILDFNQRLEIAIDVAHALTYLHVYAEKTIIHRDVKASNILLTENFRAKVSDFGFARTGPSEAGQTHISTKVKGTAGYLDPEYLRTYQLTPKSDVFSFGILLIEILSARRPVEMKRIVDERITVRWAFSKFDAGNVREVLDPKLQEDVNLEVVTKMLSLAFHCAAPTRAKRPLMKEVGEQLWEIRKDFGKSLRTE